MSEIQSLDVRIPEEIIRNWGWLLVFGICLAVLGLVAIIQSIAATKFSMLFIGSLLLLAAAIEIVQAIMVGRWAGLYQHWFGAVLYGVVWCVHHMAACGYRGNIDLADRGVFLGRRIVPIDHTVRRFPA